MQAQFSNQIVSSFYLWLDRQLTHFGRAFTNGNSQFYKINPTFNGLFTYALPYQPIIFDQSVSGAAIMSGVYLNNTFSLPGQNGLVGINYDKGQIYTSSSYSSVSGVFGLKEYNIRLTNDMEETLLFETKYEQRPKIGQTITGLLNNEVTYPVVYLRMDGPENSPFALGGLEETEIPIRAVIMTDSEFSLNAIQGMFSDMVDLNVPLVKDYEMPQNVYGGLKSGYFNYTSMFGGNRDFAYVKRVKVNAFNQGIRLEIRRLNPNVYGGFVDFLLCSVRRPRAQFL